MQATQPPDTVDPEEASERPAGRTRSWWRALVPARPLMFLIPVGALVAVVGAPGYNATSPRIEYLLRAAVVGLVAAGAVCWWWTARRGRSWGADLVPALVGGIGALTLVASLNGTPYAPGGLAGDQSFRTAAITRFADSWQNADFTFQGLPSFYAPAYFWVLGRTADLAGIEPWRMVKLGTILSTLVVPVVAYLLWRRLVPVHVAALLSVVPLVVENTYEPYSWLVMVAIVPWWVEAVHGRRRPDRSPGNPVLLGLIGALLFVTYYYFFFVAAVALVVYLVVERALGQLRWQQIRRAGLVLAIAAAASAVYWLPLLVSMLGAEHPESLANRWFTTSHPDLPLPMLDPTIVGAISLLGFGFLVWTVREPLSRGLLVLLAGVYGWYLIGAPAAAAGTPLLSFRGKPLIPMILLIAGVLALARLTRLAAARYEAATRSRTGTPTPGAAPDVAVWRVAWAMAAVLVVFVGQEFVSTIRDSPLTETAFATALPDGRLPAYHPADAEPVAPPPAQVDDAIRAQYTGAGHPVLLSDRIDILALYPYYGFLQWNAHYAHPAAEFHERVRFLDELAAATGPAQFTAMAADNRFDRIDAFVLRVDGDQLVYRFSDDAFPAGTRTVEVRFPRSLFAGFALVPLGEHVLAVHR
jgi:galactan 5-O-arabinofuranosyltransferase